MLTRILRDYLYKRAGKRLPFTAPPLRAAGQGVQQDYDDALLDFTLLIMVIPMAFVIISLLWLVFRCGKPWDTQMLSAVGGLLAFVGVCVVVVSRLRKLREKLSDLRVGWLAERVMGEALEGCRDEFKFVFHDIPREKNGRHFNIDHLAIGERGIFVVETKGKRKPEKGATDIGFDGKCLRFSDGSYADAPVRQIKAIAGHVKDWLAGLLAEKKNPTCRFGVNRPMPIKPVLAYPGWNVNFYDFQRTDFNVVVDGTLKNFVKRGSPVLSREEVDELGCLIRLELKRTRRDVVDIEK